MFQIIIRQHGMSTTYRSEPAVREPVIDWETGEIITPPKRSTCQGWTYAVARRNEQTLQSIDFGAIDGYVYAITLTIPASAMHAVMPDQFHKWLDNWIKSARRRGMLHDYWILEFTAAGTPHLHITAWMAEHCDEDVQRLLLAWLRIIRRDNIYGTVSAQDARPVITAAAADPDFIGPATPERWLWYLAKHASRGVAHYQRQMKNMPAAWQEHSGRMWGHDRKLPLKPPQRVTLSTQAFWIIRRWARNWLKSEASGDSNDAKRRRGITTCRRLLKCADPELSATRGIGAWCPDRVAIQLIDGLPYERADVWAIQQLRLTEEQRAELFSLCRTDSERRVFWRAYMPIDDDPQTKEKNADEQ